MSAKPTTYASYKAYYEKLIKHLMTYNEKHKAFREQNKNIPFRFDIPKNTITTLSGQVRELFKKESNLLRLTAPFFIFGDIHGQFSDLVRFLEMTGIPTGKNTHNVKRFIFNGDIVDRGDCSIECLTMLFCLKFCFPNDVFILRGNHECSQINKLYGFQTECNERYQSDGNQIWKELNTTLHLLPICCTINNDIFCTHGGIPKDTLSSLDDINKINRNMNIPDSGLLCDLTWSDPKTHKEKWMDNDRGISHTFNQTALNQFMRKHNLSLVCRAHQMVSEGFKFFGGNKLVTVFSAPNYCGSMGNNGAVMVINSNLEGSFIILKPVKK